MTIDQLLSLLTSLSTPGVFAGLFIYLFTKTRDESVERELWFRKTVAELTEKIGEVSQRLDRIDNRLISVKHD